MNAGGCRGGSNPECTSGFLSARAVRCRGHTRGGFRLGNPALNLTAANARITWFHRLIAILVRAVLPSGPAVLAVLTAAALPACSGLKPGISRPPDPEESSLTSPLRVERILDRLLPCVPECRCPGFIIVPSSIPNASVNAKGVIRLTTGLMEFASTDDLLAFALAHELAHNTLRHSRKRIALGWLQVLATGAVIWAAHEVSHSGSEAVRAGAGFLLTTSIFGTMPAMRRRETEADLQARDILRRAGYRPEAAAEFWHRYARTRPHRELPSWLCAHPSDKERARSLSSP